MVEEQNKDHEEIGPNTGNPFANLDEDTQAKIQELQSLEQAFQQVMMQKNAFNLENNETDMILDEVEKSEGEVMRILGGQVAIKSTKENVLKDMKRKKELISTRLKAIDKQEKDISEQSEKLRDEVMKKIQG
jgi:prefoldin beta subunit